MNSLTGSLLRDFGLGFFINGLFTITQNGFTINSVLATLIATKILIFGVLIQREEQIQWKHKQ
ncbi:hypothetical protein KDD93_07560 [Campylobacter sp. faydin G-24]|uniref:Uncharacterized protein n=1 Tax=Campylobacter anatolicus TaxID=2829105 RepID=A0ABS5HJG7_9BACT|nr:hypothetical protein [Campylobacter anatolicus]MBR8461503.1 hypothetical protein [Campylobacter anatolicus]MBR8464419.1 hypothetical protein [Campylobacter anatolicus]MBR8466206.1 hypothetical protein [Campylobacter anatolicus]